MDNLKNSTFVVFDCETTGLDWNCHQIIELAGQKVKDGKTIAEYHALINPTVPVEDEAYRVHGLSNLYLSEQGKRAQEMLPAFAEFVKDSILVGHNIMTFDIHFVNSELSRIGQGKLNNMLIDTLTMARKILPGLQNHKLTTVASHFNIDPEGAHRAMKDVEMNKQIFLKMLDQYLEILQAKQAKKKVEGTLF